MSNQKTKEKHKMRNQSEDKKETFGQRVDREKKERHEQAISFIKKMESVGKVLKAETSYRKFDKDDSFHSQVVSFKGKDVAFYCVIGSWSSKGKIKVNSDFPRDAQGSYIKPSYPEYDYQYESKSINVSETKTPEQIAKDIERRFFPEHKKELVNVLKQIKNTDNHYAGVEATTREIAKETGLEVGKHYRTGEFMPELPLPDCNKLKVSSPNSVYIELRGITKAQAVAVVNALTGKAV